MSGFDVKGVKLFSQELNFKGAGSIMVDVKGKCPQNGACFLVLTDGKNSWNTKLFIL